MLIKLLISFAVIFVLATLGFAGIGFWKIYDLGQGWGLGVALGLYLAVAIFLGLLIYRFLFCLNVEIRSLVDKIKNVADQIVNYFSELSAKPFELVKVVVKILKALKNGKA